MKAFILVALIAMVPTLAAAKSTIWCKDEGQVVDAQDENHGWQCTSAFAFGEACFTGKRSEVIEVINSELFNGDEEWLENAKYKGRDEIAYEWVDGPNELREKKTLVRCSADFFKK